MGGNLGQSFGDLDDLGEVAPDGRHQRRENNRERVILAMAELFADGSLVPTVAEVARRAEVSERSIFRYFRDVDDLTRAVIDVRIRGALPLALIPHPRPVGLDERIGVLVDSRAALYEYLGPVARVIRARSVESPVIGEEMSRIRHVLRVQEEGLFDAELGSFGPDRKTMLLVLDVMTSFESWELLRTDHSMEVASAKAVFVAGISRLLVGG
jgi:AcrR family transcriptional regulator